MPERPDHAVQDLFEVTLVPTEEGAEIVLDQGCQEGEEVGSDLGEAVAIAGDERQARGRYHLQKLCQELCIDDHINFSKTAVKRATKY